jgi:hypothetical protein
VIKLGFKPDFAYLQNTLPLELFYLPKFSTMPGQLYVVNPAGDQCTDSVGAKRTGLCLVLTPQWIEASTALIK